MWNPGSIDENFVMAAHIFGPGNGRVSYGTEYIAEDGTENEYWGEPGTWSKETWHCFQFEYQESDVNAFNGEIRVWLDGTLVLEDVDMKTREDFNQLKRPFIVGFYDSWNDYTSDPDDFWIDDAYIDNTWARVEVGDAPVYGDCTHREIQVATSWFDDSITIDANPGGLRSGTRYLFVIDENGNPSAGFPID